MSKITKDFPRFCAEVNRWITRQTGLYWIEIWLWRHYARRDLELAGLVASTGDPAAARLYEAAGRWQELADRRAAWPRWSWNVPDLPLIRWP